MTNTLTIPREQLRQEFEAANGDRAWFVQGGTSESDTPEGFVYGDFTTDMCWTCYFEARRIAAPAVERQVPNGAIENGRAFMERVEQLYDFTDGHGHQLANCSDWQEFVKCFEYLAEHTSPPAPVSVDDSTTSDKYRAELYDEVWQKARDMGFANVTDALERLDDIDGCPRLDKVKEMNQ